MLQFGNYFFSTNRGILHDFLLRFFGIIPLDVSLYLTSGDPMNDYSSSYIEPISDQYIDHIRLISDHYIDHIRLISDHFIVHIRLISGHYIDHIRLI